ncbi:uncharacterized protein LOC117325944 [Pecten maximus]|uniref:uncharacterized protein LOC117325944 n=1 Tax=Pecten maximus TaxID=6579 RepID=UPI0014584608|nr:uncharacterized protein LOC117325944 [Pecten maximus]
MAQDNEQETSQEIDPNQDDDSSSLKEDVEISPETLSVKEDTTDIAENVTSAEMLSLETSDKSDLPEDKKDEKEEETVDVHGKIEPSLALNTVLSTENFLDDDEFKETSEDGNASNEKTEEGQKDTVDTQDTVEPSLALGVVIAPDPFLGNEETTDITVNGDIDIPATELTGNGDMAQIQEQETSQEIAPNQDADSSSLKEDVEISPETLSVKEDTTNITENVTSTEISSLEPSDRNDPPEDQKDEKEEETVDVQSKGEPSLALNAVLSIGNSSEGKELKETSDDGNASNEKTDVDQKYTVETPDTVEPSLALGAVIAKDPFLGNEETTDITVNGVIDIPTTELIGNGDMAQNQEQETSQEIAPNQDADSSSLKEDLEISPETLSVKEDTTNITENVTSAEIPSLKPSDRNDPPEDQKDEKEEETVDIQSKGEPSLALNAVLSTENSSEDKELKETSDDGNASNEKTDVYQKYTVDTPDTVEPSLALGAVIAKDPFLSNEETTDITVNGVIDIPTTELIGNGDMAQIQEQETSQEVAPNQDADSSSLKEDVEISPETLSVKEDTTNITENATSAEISSLKPSDRNDPPEDQKDEKEEETVDVQSKGEPSLALNAVLSTENSSEDKQLKETSDDGNASNEKTDVDQKYTVETPDTVEPSLALGAVIAKDPFLSNEETTDITLNGVIDIPTTELIGNGDMAQNQEQETSQDIAPNQDADSSSVKEDVEISPETLSVKEDTADVTENVTLEEKPSSKCTDNNDPIEDQKDEKEEETVDVQGIVEPSLALNAMLSTENIVDDKALMETSEDGNATNEKNDVDQNDTVDTQDTVEPSLALGVVITTDPFLGDEEPTDITVNGDIDIPTTELTGNCDMAQDNEQETSQEIDPNQDGDSSSLKEDVKISPETLFVKEDTTDIAENVTSAEMLSLETSDESDPPEDKKDEKEEGTVDVHGKIEPSLALNTVLSTENILDDDEFKETSEDGNASNEKTEEGQKDTVDTQDTVEPSLALGVVIAPDPFLGNEETTDITINGDIDIPATELTGNGDMAQIQEQETSQEIAPNQDADSSSLKEDVEISPETLSVKEDTTNITENVTSTEISSLEPSDRNDPPEDQKDEKEEETVDVQSKGEPSLALNAVLSTENSSEDKELKETSDDGNASNEKTDVDQKYTVETPDTVEPSLALGAVIAKDPFLGNEETTDITLNGVIDIPTTELIGNGDMAQNQEQETSQEIAPNQDADSSSLKEDLEISPETLSVKEDTADVTENVTLEEKPSLKCTNNNDPIEDQKDEKEEENVDTQGSLEPSLALNAVLSTENIVDDKELMETSEDGNATNEKNDVDQNDTVDTQDKVEPSLALGVVIAPDPFLGNEETTDITVNGDIDIPATELTGNGDIAQNQEEETSQEVAPNQDADSSSLKKDVEISPETLSVKEDTTNITENVTSTEISSLEPSDRNDPPEDQKDEKEEETVDVQSKGEPSLALNAVLSIGNSSEGKELKETSDDGNASNEKTDVDKKYTVDTPDTVEPSLALGVVIAKDPFLGNEETTDITVNGDIDIPATELTENGDMAQNQEQKTSQEFAPNQDADSSSLKKDVEISPETLSVKEDTADVTGNVTSVEKPSLKCTDNNDPVENQKDEKEEETVDVQSKGEPSLALNAVLSIGNSSEDKELKETSDDGNASNEKTDVDKKYTVDTPDTVEPSLALGVVIAKDPFLGNEETTDITVNGDIDIPATELTENGDMAQNQEQKTSQEFAPNQDADSSSLKKDVEISPETLSVKEDTADVTGNITSVEKPSLKCTDNNDPVENQKDEKEEETIDVQSKGEPSLALNAVLSIGNSSEDKELKETSDDGNASNEKTDVDQKYTVDTPDTVEPSLALGVVIAPDPFLGNEETTDITVNGVIDIPTTELIGNGDMAQNQEQETSQDIAPNQDADSSSLKEDLEISPETLSVKEDTADVTENVTLEGKASLNCTDNNDPIEDQKDEKEEETVDVQGIVEPSLALNAVLSTENIVDDKALMETSEDGNATNEKNDVDQNDTVDTQYTVEPSLALGVDITTDPFLGDEEPTDITVNGDIDIPTTELTGNCDMAQDNEQETSQEIDPNQDGDSSSLKEDVKISPETLSVKEDTTDIAENVTSAEMLSLETSDESDPPEDKKDEKEEETVDVQSKGEPSLALNAVLSIGNSSEDKELKETSDDGNASNEKTDVDKKYTVDTPDTVEPSLALGVVIAKDPFLGNEETTDITVNGDIDIPATELTENGDMAQNQEQKTSQEFAPNQDADSSSLKKDVEISPETLSVKEDTADVTGNITSVEKPSLKCTDNNDPVENQKDEKEEETIDVQSKGEPSLALNAVLSIGNSSEDKELKKTSYDGNASNEKTDVDQKYTVDTPDTVEPSLALGAVIAKDPFLSNEETTDITVNGVIDIPTTELIGNGDMAQNQEQETSQDIAPNQDADSSSVKEDVEISPETLSVKEDTADVTENVTLEGKPSLKCTDNNDPIEDQKDEKEEERVDVQGIVEPSLALNAVLSTENIVDDKALMETSEDGNATNEKNDVDQNDTVDTQDTVEPSLALGVDITTDPFLGDEEPTDITVNGDIDIPTTELTGNCDMAQENEQETSQEIDPNQDGDSSSLKEDVKISPETLSVKEDTTDIAENVTSAEMLSLETSDESDPPEDKKDEKEEETVDVHGKIEPSLALNTVLSTDNILDDDEFKETSEDGNASNEKTEEGQKDTVDTQDTVEPSLALGVVIAKDPFLGNEETTDITVNGVIDIPTTELIGNGDMAQNQEQETSQEIAPNQDADSSSLKEDLEISPETLSVKEDTADVTENVTLEEKPSLKCTDNNDPIEDQKDEREEENVDLQGTVEPSLALNAVLSIGNSSEDKELKETSDDGNASNEKTDIDQKYTVDTPDTVEPSLALGVVIAPDSFLGNEETTDITVNGDIDIPATELTGNGDMAQNQEQETSQEVAPNQDADRSSLKEDVEISPETLSVKEDTTNITENVISAEIPSLKPSDRNDPPEDQKDEKEEDTVDVQSTVEPSLALNAVLLTENSSEDKELKETSDDGNASNEKTDVDQKYTVDTPDTVEPCLGLGVVIATVPFPGDKETSDITANGVIDIPTTELIGNGDMAQNQEQETSQEIAPNQDADSSSLKEDVEISPETLSVKEDTADVTGNVTSVEKPSLKCTDNNDPLENQKDEKEEETVDVQSKGEPSLALNAVLSIGNSSEDKELKETSDDGNASNEKTDVDQQYTVDTPDTVEPSLALGAVIAKDPFLGNEETTDITVNGVIDITTKELIGNGDMAQNQEQETSQEIAPNQDADSSSLKEDLEISPETLSVKEDTTNITENVTSIEKPSLKCTDNNDPLEDKKDENEEENVDLQGTVEPSLALNAVLSTENSSEDKELKETSDDGYGSNEKTDVYQKYTVDTPDTVEPCLGLGVVIATFPFPGDKETTDITANGDIDIPTTELLGNRDIAQNNEQETSQVIDSNQDADSSSLTEDEEVSTETLPVKEDVAEVTENVTSVGKPSLKSTDNSDPLEDVKEGKVEEKVDVKDTLEPSSAQNAVSSSQNFSDDNEFTETSHDSNASNEKTYVDQKDTADTQNTIEPSFELENGNPDDAVYIQGNREPSLDLGFVAPTDQPTAINVESEFIPGPTLQELVPPLSTTEMSLIADKGRSERKNTLPIEEILESSVIDATMKSNTEREDKKDQIHLSQEHKIQEENDNAVSKHHSTLTTDGSINLTHEQVHEDVHTTENKDNIHNHIEMQEINEGQTTSHFKQELYTKATSNPDDSLKQRLSGITENQLPDTSVNLSGDEKQNEIISYSHCDNDNSVSIQDLHDVSANQRLPDLRESQKMDDKLQDNKLNKEDSGDGKPSITEIRSKEDITLHDENEVKADYPRTVIKSDNDHNNKDDSDMEEYKDALDYVPEKDTEEFILAPEENIIDVKEQSKINSKSRKLQLTDKSRVGGSSGIKMGTKKEIKDTKALKMAPKKESIAVNDKSKMNPASQRQRNKDKSPKRGSTWTRKETKTELKGPTGNAKESTPEIEEKGRKTTAKPKQSISKWKPVIKNPLAWK